MKKLTQREAGHIEGYARALADMLQVVAEEIGGKSYDPMTVKGATMHSYCFDMKDGGRHHPISDYESVEEIFAYLLSEALDNVDAARAEKFNLFHDPTNKIRTYSKSYMHRQFPNARTQNNAELLESYGFKDAPEKK